MLLGSLLGILAEQRLWPIPKVFSYMTIRGTAVSLRAVKVQVKCSSQGGITNRGSGVLGGLVPAPDSHGVQDLLTATANKLEEPPKGFNLSNFVLDSGNDSGEEL